MIAVALLLSLATPSFDCARAQGLERTVCAEPRLAALDARLAGLYADALVAAPADAQATRGAQRTWMRARDQACGKAVAPARCLDGYYRNRIDALNVQQRLRAETAGHGPASDRYADFLGRWQVVRVSAGEKAGEITNFGDDDPRYMGLVLSAESEKVRWINGTSENSTTEACRGPSFKPRTSKTRLPTGWKAVTLACTGEGYWKEFPTPIALLASDLAELEWDEGALLHLKRLTKDAAIPPPPRQAQPPPSPPGDGREITVGDRAFFKALRSAIARDDREWLASLGDVSVNRPDGASHAYRPDEIRQVYDWIVTPRVKQAILNQPADSLGRNWQGVMIGHGDVWFDQTWDGKRWVYTILAINQTG